MRGRRVPPMPPFRQVGAANPTDEEMAQAIAGQAGVFMLAYEHDSWCRTPRTQRLEDCTCRPDTRLLRYDGGPKR